MKLFVFIIATQFLAFSLAIIKLEELTADTVKGILSSDCPPTLILSGPPSELMTLAEDFIGSLIPSILEELPRMSLFKLTNQNQFPELSAVLELTEDPYQFSLKRNSMVRKFEGKLVKTKFINFVWNNIEDYVQDLTDTDFDRITGVYTWERQSDWLIQFHAGEAYSRDLFNDVGYRLKGFTNLARVNVTTNPYLEDRFSPILENVSLPTSLFFRNRTAYVYAGKLRASNFAEFLRDFFYNPKRYHKMMYKTGPTPYYIPAPVRIYSTVWDYLSIPEIYNTLLFLGVGLTITAVRYKMRKLEEEVKAKTE